MSGFWCDVHFPTLVLSIMRDAVEAPCHHIRAPVPEKQELSSASLFVQHHQTLLLTHLSKWLQIAVAYLPHASFILQRFLFALLVLGCFFPTQFGGQSTIWLHIFPACTVSSNLIPTHNNRLDIWQWQLPGLGPHFFNFLERHTELL